MLRAFDSLDAGRVRVAKSVIPPGVRGAVPVCVEEIFRTVVSPAAAANCI